jgi:hypothetical protein
VSRPTERFPRHASHSRRIIARRHAH